MRVSLLWPHYPHVFFTGNFLPTLYNFPSITIQYSFHLFFLRLISLSSYVNPSWLVGLGHIHVISDSPRFQGTATCPRGDARRIQQRCIEQGHRIQVWLSETLPNLPMVSYSLINIWGYGDRDPRHSHCSRCHHRSLVATDKRQCSTVRACVAYRRCRLHHRGHAPKKGLFFVDIWEFWLRFQKSSSVGGTPTEYHLSISWDMLQLCRCK